VAGIICQVLPRERVRQSGHVAVGQGLPTRFLLTSQTDYCLVLNRYDKVRETT
jgi:hypothetical protein